jgi:hypothetical protein
MRKLLVAGVVVAALLVGCETKSPSGPEGLSGTTSTTTSIPPGPTPTTTTSSSTTTSVSIRNIALAFAAFNPPANVPSQMTLFARLLTAASAQAAAFAGPGGPNNQSAPENEYEITGVYVMLNGTTGTVSGVLGGTLDPLETGGVFIGRLTARTPSGCTAEREFSGTMSSLGLQWGGGAPGTSTCTPSPLAMASISMLRTTSDAPLPQPPATTSSTSTTTTSVGCTYSLSATTASVGSGSSTQFVDVNTQPGCGWSAQSFADWLTVRPPQGGSGPARVFYDVATNGTSSSRTGRLFIAGNNLNVTQAAALPDLTPGAPVPISCTVTPGTAADTLTVAIRVRNIGAANAGPSNTQVVFVTFGSSGPTTVVRPTGAIAAGSETGTSSNPDPTFPVNADSCFADLDEDGTEVCNFTVTVDFPSPAVTESDESAASNQAQGQCTRELGEESRLVRPRSN